MDEYLQSQYDAQGMQEGTPYTDLQAQYDAQNMQEGYGQSTGTPYAGITDWGNPDQWGAVSESGTAGAPTTSILPEGLASLLRSAGLINANNMPTAAAAGLVGGLYGALQPGQPQQKTGYLGGIPQYSAVRQALPVNQTPGRRPGSSGQRYFSDVQFLRPGQEPAAAPTTNMAAGGIAMLAKGGKPRYLAGNTDGMADDLPANIDGKQPARLSHGEFVIPADVVSHLGNGNSESGAKRLYAMMERIRKARTGNPKQGKQINPNKYLPA